MKYSGKPFIQILIRMCMPLTKNGNMQSQLPMCGSNGIPITGLPVRLSNAGQFNSACVDQSLKNTLVIGFFALKTFRNLLRTNGKR